MRKIVVIVILVISNFSSAQHCPYDFSDIIVLKVHTRENQNTIPNLKVTLVKKKKDKIVNSKVYILTQNNRFPFLSDEYSIIIPSRLEIKNYYLIIESVCEYGDSGWTYYGTKEIKLAENDKFPLCGNYDSNDYYDSSFGERVYKPIEVILQKSSCEIK
jgi:uncharacterized membrane protein